MKKLSKLLHEVKSLEVKYKDGLINLEHYNQDSDYDTRMKDLSENVWSKLISKELPMIQRIKIEIEQVNEFYKRFWRRHKESMALNREGNFTLMDLELFITDFFDPPKVLNEEKLFPDVSIMQLSKLLRDLHDAAMVKHGQICYLLNKINKLEKPSKPKSQTEQTGFDLGFSEPQLEVLHKALIDKGYLDKKTDIAHFKNAFNGLPLASDFEPLKWKSKTKGAIFINHYFLREEHLWSKWRFLFMPANYKQLLSQSVNQNDTFKKVADEIRIIDTSIKNIDRIDR